MERITDFLFSVFKIRCGSAAAIPATVARSLTFFKASFHGSCSAAAAAATEKPSQAVHSVSLSSSARRPVRRGWLAGSGNGSKRKRGKSGCMRRRRRRRPTFADRRRPSLQSWAGSSGRERGRKGGRAALKWLEAAMNERTVGGRWNGNSIP